MEGNSGSRFSDSRTRFSGLRTWGAGGGRFPWDSRLQGRCKPKVILFVPPCSDQVVQTLRWLEMKGKPVGVVFRRSALSSV